MSGYGYPPSGGGFGQPPGGYGQPPQGPPPNAFGPQPPYGQQPGGFAPYGGGYDPRQGPPNDYKMAGTYMLISGILTILASLVWILSLIWVCVGAFWFLTLAGGIFEVVVGTAVMNGRPHGSAKAAAIIGIICGFLTANWIGGALEVIALMNLNKPESQQYLGMHGMH